ncbi:Asp23/Gls24 family envelope stress response protein [Klenkia taihuensis]|uniref:Uncharacterized conserved protein YloU, alkaline shock protein (Asp23) family n=1 Tax=Klenkia taihuensis TaxID=1225127 RepID=A0A1I1HMR2_9ACTN|nr:Asp23/Gls24 family envelope stress response protein [Klenkia taihuensis]GHE09208.1 hypothetical protein GCM10011381_13070 [Klenkia taihuensis]SFC22753.1 Uncharacterized conserved protein YloU, alkaline shock protein (Asp23) family [Klenkia taihuensis]
MTTAAAALVAGLDPRVLAAAVRACPGVAGLSGGPFGGVGTYLPGERVTGVVVRETAVGPPDVAVHLVCRAGVPVAEVAGQVRSALATAAPGSRVDVRVEDVDTGEDRR